MLATLTDLLWSYVLIAVLLAVGITLTLTSRFVQVRHFGRMFGVLGQAFRRQPGQVSSFQALTLSVAGRVGGGNIAGVAVAIVLGGPGAIFWMWLIGLIGMATSFFECTLAQVYKVREPDGTFRGGPAFYMSRGLKNKPMAAAFSILLLLSFGMAFVAFQSFTASSSLEDAFGIPSWVSGLSLAVITGIIVFGGVRRIAAITEIIVPLMAVAYILVALVVVALNFSLIPEVLMLIVKSAFGLQEAIGGGIGAAIMMGVRRGLFSNEAGMGSAPNAAAAAAVPHPASQGIVQALSVFIDTAIICTATAFIILMTDSYLGVAEAIAQGIEFGDAQAIALTQNALAIHVGQWGQWFVSVSLLLFAFSSILYNYYMAENSLSWFSNDSPLAIGGVRLMIVTLILWGSMQDLSTIFAFADLSMGLLALVNLIALALLFKVGLRIMADYERQLHAGQSPVFDPDRFPDLDIDRKAWGRESDSVDDNQVS